MPRPSRVGNIPVTDYWNSQAMGTLFDGYATTRSGRKRKRAARPWDEMFPTEPGTVREPYRELYPALSRMSQDELRGRTDALASSYLAQGVTFDFAGEERPFPLDAVPRVIAASDWSIVEAGVAQRVRALERFLADVYGPQHAIRDGVIPAALISSSTHYHRQAAGIVSANGVRVHVSGIDVIRDELGAWRVLEDNVRVPSGVSYVISNRRVMAQTLPELFTAMRVRPVGDYPNRLLQALRASAPEGVEDPTVVVLTPGVYNSAYYEHTLLARLMGVELVEGRDLFCSGGRVWMRTTAGPTRVDVIYRRVDDEFLDPQQFRPDSVLGAPGLMLAARLGHVTIANAVGNGVADDKLVYTYVPDLIRYFLGEEPILPNVDTWRLEEPAALAEVLDRLDELVVKPVDGSGGKGLVVGPDASRSELAELRLRLLADPRGWIAQPVVQLSTIPTLVEDGMRPRHADLRPFAVNDGNDVWVLPGGLTRVALPEGQLVVNSSQGGGSKDTWVLDSDLPTGPVGAQRFASSAGNVGALVADQAAPATASVPVVAATPTEHALHPPEASPQDEDAPIRQQQQQQQQQRMPRHPLDDGGGGASVLSRIAESLFWIGRYIERSDGTARILDVHLQLLLEDPWIDEDTACRSLLSVMGSEANDDVALGRDDVIALLAVDRTHPASIAHSIAAARENARRAREIVSTELWEALNQTNARMPRRVASDKTHEFFRWVRDRSALAIGVVDSATSRDEAWHFFSLGRAIERADMTARLLATRSLTEASGPSWTTILRSCGGYEAYLRSYRGVPSSQSAAEFLLLDRLFPRSIISSVIRAEESLREIDPRAGRVGVTDQARRLLGQIRSELEYRPIADILVDLAGHMEHVQAVTSSASEAIRQRYFPASVAPVWIGEVS